MATGVKPKDPLCKAVTALLAIAGLHYSTTHVSDMLRDRADRPRSGGRKKLQKAPPTPAAGGRKTRQKVPA